MKMKRVTLCLSLIAAALITGCKKEPNVVPEADTEVQSAIDVAFATYVITDIDMMCSFMGENTLLQHFFTAQPGTASGSTGTMTATRDTMNNSLAMSFNKTKCMDGRLRDGTVYMDWEDLDNIATNNDNYIRDFKYRGRLALLNYKVDGWIVDEYNEQAPAYIYNTLPGSDYSTSSTNVTWSIEGKFKFTNPTDSSRNMVWDGKLKKTLVNTSNKKVMDPSKQKAIVWDSAIVSYSGKVSGLVSSTVPFDMEVSSNNPLIRDFRFNPKSTDSNKYPNCQEVLAAVPTVTTGGNVVLTTLYSTHHPFIKGIASFTPGVNTNNQKYPRQIYFGNEGNTDLPAQCDNKGEVLIKGVSYSVDFMK
jgi:hypothetical protein